MRNGSPRERASSTLALTMAAGVGVLLVALMLMVLPVEAVQRPPRPDPPTVEQVKLFTCDYRASCTENLEGQVNAWFKSEQSDVTVIDRKFVMADRGMYAIAIFYRKSAAQKKLPAEAPR